MNISIIGPTHPYKGGISHFTTLLVKELRMINNVQFISWKRQYPSFLYPVEQKDTLSKNPIKEDAEFILDFFNPFTWIITFLKIKNSGTEILIFNWVSPIQGPIYFVISTLTKAFTTAKVLYICHNVLPHEKKIIDIPLTKLAFTFADSFVVHSEDDKKDLEKITKKKTIILGFLPIFSMFANTQRINIAEVKNKLKLKKNVLLFFGYIRQYKGLMYLIEAMPGILKQLPNTTLLVVGEFWSNDKVNYFNKVKDLKIQDSVVFIDRYVPNEEIGKYFKIADVSVLPYITATQSAVIQTSFFFNKPVISTPVGGLKDVIDEGKTGYFIKPQNSDDITKKVTYFFEHPIKSENINKAKEKFSWKRYIKLIAT